MIRWNPGATRPDDDVAAAIVIRVLISEAERESTILLGEIYRFDVATDCWVGHLSGLRLKHTVFWWAAEADLLEGLPQ